MTEGLEARLARLEAESVVLDPPPEARHVLRDPVLAYSDRFLDGIKQIQGGKWVVVWPKEVTSGGAKLIAP